MGIRLKAIDEKELVPFVPQFGGEAEKKAGNPDYAALTFHLRRMTEREAEAYREVTVTEAGQVEINQEDCARIVFAHAAQIENLSLVGSDGKRIEVDNGERLRTHRDQLPATTKHLFAEVALHLINMSGISEEEEKN
ncbi:MAG: hypothetical protein P9L99_19810 [Candidatus Lernaella stagnicola]|nr:hypothetical protein [Candidatus Lernaella stagnicola]